MLELRNYPIEHRLVRPVPIPSDDYEIDFNGGGPFLPIARSFMLAGGIDINRWYMGGGIPRVCWTFLGVKLDSALELGSIAYWVVAGNVPCFCADEEMAENWIVALKLYCDLATSWIDAGVENQDSDEIFHFHKVMRSTNRRAMRNVVNSIMRDAIAPNRELLRGESPPVRGRFIAARKV